MLSYGRLGAKHVFSELVGWVPETPNAKHIKEGCKPRIITLGDFLRRGVFFLVLL